MKLQERKYSCGAANVRCALYVLGHKRLSEATIRKKCGTTPDGTDEFDILRGIKAYGHRARECKFSSGKEAWHWLRATLGRGKVVLMCTDNEGHWVTAVGRLGGRIWIYDPDSTTPPRQRRYSTLELVSKEELTSRWGNPIEGQASKFVYYAICVTG